MSGENIPALPFERNQACPFDPPSRYAGLREEEPISPVRNWDGEVAWLLTRYEAQRALLSDPRFSNNIRHEGYPTPGQALKSGFSIGEVPFMFTDDPEHGRMRRMFTRYFTVRRVAEMAPRIRQIIDRFLDDVETAGPPADLVSTFARPLPSLVISEVLGVPPEDQGLFQSLAHVISNTKSTPADLAVAMGELAGYLGKLIDTKDREPTDDLLSGLVVNHLRSGEINREQLVLNSMMVLNAGHETTTNMIALGVLALLRNPEQLAAIRDSEDLAAVALAVEELLRYLTVANGRRRVAIEDAEFEGKLIRAGEGVVLANDSANRDQSVFENPDQLDLSRHNAREHLAFGRGSHQCLGQNLARLELQLAYPALLRRFPNLRTAVADEEIKYKRDAIVYGVHELPVAW